MARSTNFMLLGGVLALCVLASSCQASIHHTRTHTKKHRSLHNHEVAHRRLLQATPPPPGVNVTTFVPANNCTLAVTYQRVASVAKGSVVNDTAALRTFITGLSNNFMTTLPSNLTWVRNVTVGNTTNSTTIPNAIFSNPLAPWSSLSTNLTNGDPITLIATLLNTRQTVNATRDVAIAFVMYAWAAQDQFRALALANSLGCTDRIALTSVLNCTGTNTAMWTGAPPDASAAAGINPAYTNATSFPCLKPFPARAGTSAISIKATFNMDFSSTEQAKFNADTTPPLARNLYKLQPTLMSDPSTLDGICVDNCVTMGALTAGSVVATWSVKLPDGTDPNVVAAFIAQVKAMDPKALFAGSPNAQYALELSVYEGMYAYDSSSNNKKALAIGLGVGLGGAFLIAAIAGGIVCMRRKNQQVDPAGVSAPLATQE